MLADGLIIEACSREPFWSSLDRPVSGPCLCVQAYLVLKGYESLSLRSRYRILVSNSLKTTRLVSTMSEFGTCISVDYVVYVSLSAVSCFADKTLNLHINASKSLRCYLSIRA